MEHPSPDESKISGSTGDFRKIHLIHFRLAHYELSLKLICQWLFAPLLPLATMRAWNTVQQWFSLVHFVLAVVRAATSPGINISFTGSVSSTSGSNYGGSSATATSTVTSSLPGSVSLTSVASGPSTQAQLNIPINPASFSPFPVPSDIPIPLEYLAVDPSQPPSVSYAKLSFDFC